MEGVPIDWSKAITFRPGDPPRTGRLVGWDHAASGGLFASVEGAGTTLRVALRRGNGVEIDEVPVAGASVGEVLVDLLGAPVETLSASARWYRRAAEIALDLIERGRFVPDVSVGGFDAWRIDPLEPGDRDLLERLADAAPPEAHALAADVVAGRARRARMVDPRWLVRAWLDAVCDTFVRTLASSEVVGCHLWAETDPVPAAPARSWTTAAWGHLTASVRLGLRIESLDAPRPEPGVLRFDDLDPDGELDLDPGTPDATERRPRPAPGRFRVVPQVRSTVEGSLVVDLADLADAPAAVRRRLGPSVELDVLVAFARAREIWPTIDDGTGTTGAPVEIDLDALEELHAVSPLLEARGVEVLWPASFGAELTPKLVANATAAPGGGSAGLLALSTILEFHWQVLCDGEELDDHELDQLADARRTVVWLRGRWVRTDPDVIKRLRSVPDPIVGADALAAALAGETVVDGGEVVEVHVDDRVDDLRRRLAGLGAPGAIPDPPGLRAELRSYQRTGVSWMNDLCDIGLGGILADDMGLGKTLQVIALHLVRVERGGGPTLIVVPTSVLGNWRREFRRFAPHVGVAVASASSHRFEPPSPEGVLLTTYGLARRNAERLAGTEWGLVVADEAQQIKNPRSRVARALRTIGARSRIALSGTPVENRLSELWALVDWVCPGLLGSADDFHRKYVVPIERDNSAVHTARLSQLVRPFMLRRRKTEPGIADELPERIHRDVVLPLTAEQLSLYEAVVRESLAEIANREGRDRVGLVFRLLTALKQIANHPAQYLHETDGPLGGRSGKLDYTTELVGDLVDGGARVLVFSQYVEMCRMIVQHFGDHHLRAELLHGGLPAAARDRLVERFQAGELPVLVISLKAGGTGLNLTAASEVIHYDRWWNPAVEDQATDRAWRIGQRNVVNVHRLIAEGTIDERIAEMIERKRSLAEAVVGGGEGWIAELDDDALAELVTLRQGTFEEVRV